MTGTPPEMFREITNDIERWKSQVHKVAPTHCQGIGNKAANRYEGLLKIAAQHYIEYFDASLEDLLEDIGYKGNAKDLGKLSQGVIIESLRALAKHSHEFAAYYCGAVEEGARRVVQLRNEISHEDTGDALRSKVSALLEKIQSVLRNREFWDPVRGDQLGSEHRR